MYIRVSGYKSGGKSYRHLKLVQAYRDGRKVKQKIIANLGNLEKFSQQDIDNIFNGLCRAFERPLPGETEYINAPSYGDVHVIVHIWHELKLAQIVARQASRSRTKFDLEAHIRTMVINRLCDPKSKLALLAWLEGVYLPGIDREGMKYHHLLRAMDWLIEHKDEIEVELPNSVLTLFDRELDLVFYDITSSYFETELTDELRKYGFSRDKRGDCPQVTIGMVCTREGIPIHHTVFPGNTTDKTTVRQMVRDLKARFPITRAVFVGDRGMITRANIEVLREEKLDYIVAVNMRNDNAAEDLVGDFEDEVVEARAEWKAQRDRFQASGDLPEGCKDEDDMLRLQRLFGEAVIGGRRLVVEHCEQVARVSARQRAKRIDRTQQGIEMVVGKLEAQDRGEKNQGRPLSEEGAIIKMHELVSENRLGHTYKLKLEDGYVKVVFDELALDWEATLDGKLVVETSLEDLTPEQVIEQYRGLREIEESFRVLKSTLELRPMNHWTPPRIKAHVFICVLALVIERVMKARLRRAGESMVPSRALEVLSNVRAVIARTSNGVARGLTYVDQQQRSLFKALGVPVPSYENVQ